MKKIGCAFLLVICFSSLRAQNSEELARLNNSLYELWQNGNSKEAIKNSEKLFALSPPAFTDNIHKVLAQLLQKGNNNASNYLRGLYAKNNAKINKVIKPLYLWNEALRVNSPDSLAIILTEFDGIISNHPAYDSRAERYGILTVKLVNSKNGSNSEAANKLLSKIILRQEEFPYIKVPAMDYKVNDERGWRRYLLAYSYDYIYSASGDVKYLEKAAAYSPDMYDQTGNDSYFYDAHLLNTDEPADYRVKYSSWLASNGKQEEALKTLADFTFNYPEPSNIKALKDFFQSVMGESDFRTYWHSFISSRAESFPQLTLKFDRADVNFNKSTGKWTYVDIWGTWCGPCLQDLPNLQKYYQDNLSKSNKDLDIYTFSYGSQNLAKFMAKNNYNFPVAEIDNAIVKKLKIAYYPTRILITPDRKYLKIPFNADWQVYLDNYILND